MVFWMLIFSFVVFLFFLFFCKVWVRLIFFLIYIGGVMVLLFYIFSLYSNTYLGGKGAGLGLFLFGLLVRVFRVWFGVYNGEEVTVLFRGSDIGKELYGGGELVLLFEYGGFLVFVLWVISKILFNVGGSVRSFD